ncbi:MAG TPA: lysophospholipid acyltransferase family protein [Exilispira sp.]|nr:lysophospholipid acyltransferase family protein [Exilispira sp.]
MKQRRKIKISTILCSFITYIIALPIQTIIFFIGLIVKKLKLNNLFIFLSKQWSLFFFKIIGVKLKAYGLENIDKNKNYLIVANHSSYYDIAAIMSFLPNTVWVANKRFFKVLFFGSLLKEMDAIPVDSKRLKETINKINERARKLRKNSSSSIAIFPEGTRTLDGNIHKFKRGFITIWQNTKFDLLPITINGTYLVKPKWSFLIYHTKVVSLHFHKPIPYEELQKYEEKEITEIIKKIIEKDYENQNIS